MSRRAPGSTSRPDNVPWTDDVRPHTPSAAPLGHHDTLIATSGGSAEAGIHVVFQDLFEALNVDLISGPAIEEVLGSAARRAPTSLPVIERTALDRRR